VFCPGKWNREKNENSVFCDNWYAILSPIEDEEILVTLRCELIKPAFEAQVAFLSKI